jgi:hypothetical protein
VFTAVLIRITVYGYEGVYIGQLSMGVSEELAASIFREP